MNIKDFIKDKFKKKNVKYGAAGMLLTVVVIAFILVINLIFTFISDKFGLYADLTKEQIYNVSEDSKALLADMDCDTRIIFLTPLDELDSNEYSKSVVTLAKEYEKIFPGVKLEYIDMIKNPGEVAKYRKEYTLSSTSVIVESQKRFVVFDMSDCFVYRQDDKGNYSYYAFNGEYRFTSSLMKVTTDDIPKVVFTMNHGEEKATYFENIFSDSCFDVVELDLSQEQIPEGTKMIVINNPIKDLTGIEYEDMGESESTKLSKFISGGGNVMVFVNPQTETLKNLGEICNSCGISLCQGETVIDTKEYLASMDEGALIATVTGDETVKALSGSVAESGIKVISYNTMPLEILPITDVNRAVSPILLSSKSGKVAGTDKKGSIPLMAVSYLHIFNGDTGETETSYLLVGGSTYFTSDVFLGANSSIFANAELVRSVVSKMTDEKMILNISYKVYDDTSLTVDGEASKKWLGILVLVMPCIILASAIAVFLRRRHK